MKTHLRIALATLGLAWGSLVPATAQYRVADYTFGGSRVEVTAGIIPASDGGFIVGGSTISGVSGDVTLPARATGVPASMDYWMFKMDAQGTKLWEQRYGGSGDDRLIKVLPSADGGYLLCGWTDSPTGSADVTGAALGGRKYWVLKTDAQGTKLWDKKYGSLSGEILYDAIATPDGGYLLTGNSGSTVSGGAAPSGDRTQRAKGPMDIWTIKLDAQGNKQWDSTLGGLDGDYVYSVVNMAGGGYALLGLSFGPVSGDVTGPGNGNYDLWVIKLDNAGNKTWDRLYGGSGYDEPHTLLATADGGLLVGGGSGSPISGDVSQGGGGLWLLKLDASGTKQWDQVYAGTGIDRFIDLQALPDGGYAAVGREGITGNPLPTAVYDVGLINVSATGTLRWARFLGGPGSERGVNMLVLPNGNVLLATNSDSDIGRDKTQDSQGDSDIWILETTATTTLAAGSPQPLPSLRLYPNPASTAAPVAVQLDGLRPQAPVQLELLNVLGQRVYAATVAVQQGSIRPQVPVAALPAGLYTLRVQAAEGVLTKKLLRN